MIFGGMGMGGWWAFDYTMDALTTSPGEAAIDQFNRNFAEFVSWKMNHTNDGIQEYGNHNDYDTDDLGRGSPYDPETPIELNRRRIIWVSSESGDEAARRHKRNVNMIRMEEMHWFNASKFSSRKVRDTFSEERKSRQKRSETVQMQFEELFHLNIEKELNIRTYLDDLLDGIVTSAEKGDFYEILWYTQSIVDQFEQVMGCIHNNGFPYLLYSHSGNFFQTRPMRHYIYPAR